MIGKKLIKTLGIIMTTFSLLTFVSYNDVYAGYLVRPGEDESEIQVGGTTNGQYNKEELENDWSAISKYNEIFNQMGISFDLGMAMFDIKLKDFDIDLEDKNNINSNGMYGQVQITMKDTTLGNLIAENFGNNFSAYEDFVNYNGGMDSIYSESGKTIELLSQMSKERNEIINSLNSIPGMNISSDSNQGYILSNEKFALIGQLIKNNPSIGQKIPENLLEKIREYEDKYGVSVGEGGLSSSDLDYLFISGVSNKNDNLELVVKGKRQRFYYVDRIEVTVTRKDGGSLNITPNDSLTNQTASKYGGEMAKKYNSITGRYAPIIEKIGTGKYVLEYTDPILLLSNQHDIIRDKWEISNFGGTGNIIPVIGFDVSGSGGLYEIRMDVYGGWYEEKQVVGSSAYFLRSRDTNQILEVDGETKYCLPWIETPIITKTQVTWWPYKESPVEVSKSKLLNELDEQTYSYFKYLTPERYYYQQLYDTMRWNGTWNHIGFESVYNKYTFYEMNGDKVKVTSKKTNKAPDNKSSEKGSLWGSLTWTVASSGNQITIPVYGQDATTNSAINEIEFNVK